MKSKKVFKYSQPDFYRFNEDSTLLAKEVASFLVLDSKRHNIKVLDLCAGCGIVGLELIDNCDHEIILDFLELQRDFEGHLRDNIKNFNEFIKSFDHTVYMNSFLSLKSIEFRKKYDVIISNPPYFLEGKGRPSPNMKKNICRFFQQRNLDEFVSSALFALKRSGYFFFLGRNKGENGSHLERMISKDVLAGRRLEVLKSFPGADLFLVRALDE
jgi:tRNA1(Val) A37 N6-methylase TrmN6